MKEKFCDDRGSGCRSLCGEHTTASFWREPLLCGSHAFAGGMPLRGAKLCSPRKASLPSIIRQKISITIN